MYRDTDSVVRSRTRFARLTAGLPSRAGLAGALGLLLCAAPAGAATLSPDAAVDFEIAPLVEGIGQPTDIAILADGRKVITMRGGDVITVLADNTTQVEDHIDVIANHGEQGLLGVVADPNFATNQYLYFYASANTDPNNRHQVQRFKLGADSLLSDVTIVVDAGLQGPANHNGGGLDIYGGHLYVAVGDTGENDTPPVNKYSTCLNHANGKILRVSLAEATLGEPVADNPLMALSMVTACNDAANGEEPLGMQPPDKRIFAWGFRNPFRFWVDPTSGKLWIGDVGEMTREEISVGDGGQHYGYPFQEGTRIYTTQEQDFQPADACMGVVPASACVPPVYDYANSGANDCVIGGRILDGCEWPAVWKSRYIFGDHGSGQVWTLDVNPTRDGVVGTTAKDFALAAGPVAFRIGPDNALYIVEEQGGGAVQRVTAKGAPTSMASCAPAGGGSGGSGGSGGAGTAGSAPTAGANTGGSGTAGAAAGSAGSGGAGTAGSGGGGATDDGGCGCRLAGAPRSSELGWGALLSVLAFAWTRRRRHARP